MVHGAVRTFTQRITTPTGVSERRAIFDVYTRERRRHVVDIVVEYGIAVCDASSLAAM
ncbi:hypothetical protein PTKU15_92720 [Paraburkholderia terrae]|nr:hypothetical protein PTKU15_92720 [Paraburkholderia terrae]